MSALAGDLTQPLRDDIKADYADKENGLAKQRSIQQVMERIVTQTIPQVAATPIANTFESGSVAVAANAIIAPNTTTLMIHRKTSRAGSSGSREISAMPPMKSSVIRGTGIPQR